MAQDDGCRQLGRDRAQGGHEVGPSRDVSGVGRAGGLAKATQELADQPKPSRPPVRDRPVDCDPVDPCLGRRVRAPAAPRLEGLDERILGAVLSFGGIAKDDHQGAVDAWIRTAIEAIKVLSRAGLVRLLRALRQRLHGCYNAKEYSAWRLGV